jgi:3-oxoacyl-[acyl-carrier-protein] synthase-3
MDNAELERMVDTSNEWIIERTGIRERRIAAPEEATSDLATQAARVALERAGVAPEDLDLIILATITPDSTFPATACLVQRNLGARNAGAIDVSAACSGFVYALSLGADKIRAGSVNHVLVIAGECMSRITNWEDRNTCVLFGDGAGAVLLQSSEKESLLFENLCADGNLSYLIEQKAGGSRLPASEETVRQGLHFIEVRGRETFRYAVKILAKAIRRAVRRLEIAPDAVDLIIPHQANIRIIEAAASAAGLPMEKFYVNLDRYGNTSGATIAIALHEAVQEGRLKEGDLCLMISFGSGFTYATSAMRWIGNGA